MEQIVASNPVIVDVHIEEALTQSHRQRIGKLTWYYNGFSGLDLSLLVAEPHDGIEFRLTPATAKKFIFAKPLITPSRDPEGQYYPDLNGDYSEPNEHTVIITDLMIDKNMTKVGSIVLQVNLRDETGNQDVAYDLETFKSDPEVINTGQES